MKQTVLILLLLKAGIAFSQKIALLNLDLKHPIIYTDSVTAQQVTTGLFPVSIEDFDTLYANLDYIHSMLKVLQRSKMKSFELHSGATIIMVKRAPFAFGDRYLITAKTKIGELESNLNIAPLDKSNARNADRVKRLMAYMKTNKDLFKSPTSITPKIFKIVIISE